MKSLLVFIPSNFYREKPGYIYGKVVYDDERDSKKFYIVGTTGSTNNSSNVIGYFSKTQEDVRVPENTCNWIEIVVKAPKMKNKNSIHRYGLENVIVDSEKVSTDNQYIVIIIYDQIALMKIEYLEPNLRESDFSELKDILGEIRCDARMEKNDIYSSLKKTLRIYFVFFLLYPVLILSRITESLLPVLRYSTLGMHLKTYFENAKWMLLSIRRDKKLTLKSRNHIFATMLDIFLGNLALQLLLHSIGETLPSEIMLENAEEVVETLRSLVDWLMGAPAGLKLNHSFNKMLGHFFLYHIHLWWTFFVFIQPFMDFAFQVLQLFGRLGLTFQISIAADILALVSFHTYCIYVYAARLFNIQLRGLTGLFRLFLGKKKNPLRDKVDSCSYKADQLFVGTLIFTILLFLMPTTWVYYSVFTTLRLILIGFGGFLSRLRFYLQVIPVYTGLCWLFRSNSTKSSVQLSLVPSFGGEPIIMTMTTVASGWSKTWVQFIPDTMSYHPPIEWTMIISNILWGELLYPL